MDGSTNTNLRFTLRTKGVTVIAAAVVDTASDHVVANGRHIPGPVLAVGRVENPCMNDRSRSVRARPTRELSPVDEGEGRSGE